MPKPTQGESGGIPSGDQISNHISVVLMSRCFVNSHPCLHACSIVGRQCQQSYIVCLTSSKVCRPCFPIYLLSGITPNYLTYCKMSSSCCYLLVCMQFQNDELLCQKVIFQFCLIGFVKIHLTE